MKFSVLLFILLSYYVYRSYVKPYLAQISKKEDAPTFRFEKKAEPQKQADESDYIDYEEVD